MKERLRRQQETEGINLSLNLSVLKNYHLRAKAAGTFFTSHICSLKKCPRECIRFQMIMPFERSILTRINMRLSFSVVNCCAEAKQEKE